MSVSRIPVPVTRAQTKHKKENRTFEGIPLIGISPKGRLFAGWYSGGTGENCENYVGIAISDDRGETWTDLEWVVDPPEKEVRAFDATMWLSPENVTYLFWTQTWSSAERGGIFDGYSGVWFSILKNPDDPVADFQWTDPVRISDGIMMNKPFVMSDGTWGLPIALWTKNLDLGDVSQRGAKIFVSTDHGKSFTERGKAICDPEWASFDEHAIIELPDGRLKMLIRCHGGYQESYSADKGYIWTKPVKSEWVGPDSRPCFIQLKSGNYIMIGNDSTRREKMTAWFLKDGMIREGGLMLDEQNDVSYPDMVQDNDGTIYIIHDFNRYKGGFMYLSRIHEDDLKAGKLVNPDSRLHIEIAHSNPVPPAPPKD